MLDFKYTLATDTNFNMTHAVKGAIFDAPDFDQTFEALCGEIVKLEADYISQAKGEEIMPTMAFTEKKYQIILKASQLFWDSGDASKLEELNLPALAFQSVDCPNCNRRMR